MIYASVSHYMSFSQPESEYHGYSIKEADTSSNEQKDTHKLHVIYSGFHSCGLLYLAKLFVNKQSNHYDVLQRHVSQSANFGNTVYRCEQFTVVNS